MHGLSPLRLNLLRVFYLVLVVGLGMQIWPAMIQRVYSISSDHTYPLHPATPPPRRGAHVVRAVTG